MTNTRLKNTYKALVLAAGHGSRMRPVTEFYPKPLIPLFGSSALELAVDKIENAGISDIVINSHYLAEHIEEWLKAKQPSNASIKISYEQVITGTGGAIKATETQLNGHHLLVHNGDIISDVDLNWVLEEHEKHGCDLSVVIRNERIPGELGLRHHNQQLLELTREPGDNVGSYACMLVIAPNWFGNIPKEAPSCIMKDAVIPALEKDSGQSKIAALADSFVWHDIRTPSFYYLALRDIASRASKEPDNFLRNLGFKDGIILDEFIKGQIDQDPNFDLRTSEMKKERSVEVENFSGSILLGNRSTGELSQDSDARCDLIVLPNGSICKIQ